MLSFIFAAEGILYLLSSEAFESVSEICIQMMLAQLGVIFMRIIPVSNEAALFTARRVTDLSFVCRKYSFVRC